MTATDDVRAEREGLCGWLRRFGGGLKPAIEAADLIETQAARIKELEAEQEFALSLPDAADAYANGYQEGLNDAENSEVGKVIVERDAALGRAAIEQAIRKDTERRLVDLQQIRMERDDLRTRAERAEAEVARLREALREIDDLCPATQEVTTAHMMADIARAALQPRTHSHG